MCKVYRPQGGSGGGDFPKFFLGGTRGVYEFFDDAMQKIGFCLNLTKLTLI